MSKVLFYDWGRGEYGYHIMLDAIRSGQVDLLTPKRLMENRNLWFIYNQLFIRRLLRNHLKIEKLFYPLFVPNSISRTDIVCFHESHFLSSYFPFLNWIKKRYKKKLVLVIRNPIVNKRYPIIGKTDLNIVKGWYDLVVTDEEWDAKKYGLMFMPDPFSRPDDTNISICDDFCFIGENKGRATLLSDIARIAHHHGIRYNIKVVGNPRNNNSLIEYIPSHLSYSDLLAEDLKANCILEVLQKGQESFTLRLQEAVCMNRKLMTNNTKVIETKYYNPKFIRIFSAVEDIDWDFIKERIPVDYGYEGEFSPVVFLERIRNALN